MQEIYHSDLCFNYNLLRVLGGGVVETEGKKHKNLYLLGASRNQISVLYSGGVGGWYRKKNIQGWQGARVGI